MIDTRRICHTCWAREMETVSPLTGEPSCRECHAKTIAPSGRYKCPVCEAELHGDLLGDRIVVLWCAVCDYARAFKAFPADRPDHHAITWEVEICAKSRS